MKHIPEYEHIRTELNIFIKSLEISKDKDGLDGFGAWTRANERTLQLMYSLRTILEELRYAQFRYTVD